MRPTNRHNRTLDLKQLTDHEGALSNSHFNQETSPVVFDRSWYSEEGTGL